MVIDDNSYGSNMKPLAPNYITLSLYYYYLYEQFKDKHCLSNSMVIKICHVIFNINILKCKINH